MVKRVRVSGTFDTKAAALAWEASQRVQLADGKAKVAEETCKDAFDRYEREVSRKRQASAGRASAWPPWAPHPLVP